MFLLLLARSLAETDETSNTDELPFSSAFRTTLLPATPSPSDPSAPASATQRPSPSPAATAEPGGLDPVRSILLVMFSIIVVTILGITAGYCYKRLKRRGGEDDERLDEPLLIPSEEF
jgi:hypothetical protein